MWIRSPSKPLGGRSSTPPRWRTTSAPWTSRWGSARLKGCWNLPVVPLRSERSQDQLLPNSQPFDHVERADLIGVLSLGVAATAESVRRQVVIPAHWHRPQSLEVVARVML